MTLDEITSTTDRPNGADRDSGLPSPTTLDPTAPAEAASENGPSGRSVDELARIANEALADTERLVAEAVKRAIVAGDALNEAQRQLEHGEWLGWLKQNFRGTARTAQRFMLLATLAAYMPDAVQAMGEHTINGALACLRTAFENRQAARGLKADTYTAEVGRVWRSYGSVLNEAREGLGDEHWRLWLANIGITEELALIYIDISEEPAAGGAKLTWATVPGPVPSQILQALRQNWDRESPRAKTTPSRISKKAVTRAKNEHAPRASKKGSVDDRPRRERAQAQEPMATPDDGRPWAKTYDFAHLKALGAPFRRQHEPHIFGRHGLTNESGIATALENGMFYSAPAGAPEATSAAIGRLRTRVSHRSDFAGRDITIPPSAFVIDAIAARDDEDGARLMDDLLAKAGTAECWAKIFEEDQETKTVLLKRKFRYMGTKVEAGSEIKGFYILGDPPPLAPEAAADAPTVEVLRSEFLSETDLGTVVQELAAYGEHWVQHYSSYNKRKSYTAFALRGYDPADPNFIIFPDEMSKDWKEENPERLGAKPGWTPAVEHFPGTLAIVKRVGQLVGSASDSDLLRVRFMQLAPKGGELSRHADVTDHMAGTADGKNVRLHLPIKTNDKVLVQAWDARGNMMEKRFPRGALCYLDVRKPHRVVNDDPEVERIHLVIDIKSSQKFRDLLASTD